MGYIFLSNSSVVDPPPCRETPPEARGLGRGVYCDRSRLMPLLALLPALALPAAAGVRVPLDSLEAKSQVRVCLSLAVEKDVAIQGCRRAIELGLSRDWAAAIRLYLARRLADAMRWDEVVEVYRDHADRRPRDAEAHLRLGNALLFGASRAAEAEAAYRQALTLAPDQVTAWAGLGASLNALARHAEATSAFERLLAIDPAYFDTNLICVFDKINVCALLAGIPITH